MRVVPASAVLLTAALSMASAASQTASSPDARPAPEGRSASAAPPQPDTPVFPSAAEVVVLDMVVRGKDGQPVRDLRPDEVQVFEDGRPCRVQGFRLVLPEGAPSQTAAASSATSAIPPASTGAAYEARPAVGSLVILAFDQLDLEGARNARAAALDFVGRPFPAKTWFAVFKIGQGLFPLQGFTGDPRKLKQAIERATTGVDQPRDPSLTGRADNATQEAFAAAAEATRLEGAGGSNPAEAQIARALARMLQMSDRAAREERGRGALFPLISLAKGLRTVSGRKTLLLFSEGLHVPDGVAEVYARAISEANRANVAIYSLDASGLRALDGRGKVFSPFTESAMALEQAGEGRSDTREGMKGGENLLDGLRMNVQANLRDLAEATGGFLIANTNDLRPGLERVGAELRSFYEIAYAPANAKADGRFRSIEVKVSRPGVSVRTRRGYYALPPGAPVMLPYELALAEALAAPPLPRELEHRVAALRFADVSPEPEALLLVEVPHRQLTLTRDEAAQAFRGLVSLLVQVKDENGATVTRLSHEAPIEGRLADLDRVRDRSTLVKRAIRLKPGRYTLETAVQDHDSGRVGARRTVFEVPAPAAGLSLGDVVIVRADTVPAAPASDDPLRVGTLSGTPQLGVSVAEGTPALSLYLSLHPGAGAEPAAVELEFRRDGQTVARSKPQLPAPDAHGRIAYIGSFPIGTLGAGRYELWARARQGTAEALATTGFTVTPRPTLFEAREGDSDGAVADAAAKPEQPATAPPYTTKPGAGTLEDTKEPATPLATILERAGQYVLRYEDGFKDVVAEEAYRQWQKRTETSFDIRNLRSDLVFVRLPGPLPWGTFRDVYEVDGRKVRDRERRLEKLFASAQPSWEQAEAILKESSRYNLGRAYRNVNVPTLALLFLRPENQRRLQFKRRGTRTLAGFPSVEVEFEERASPTLVHDSLGNDVPARGRFFVDPTRGTVLRTEIEYDLETDPAERVIRNQDEWQRGVVITDYRQELAFGQFVPETMTEWFRLRGIGTVEATARYSNYRRFGVDVAWAAAGGIAEAPGSSATDDKGWVDLPPLPETASVPSQAEPPAIVPRAEPAPLPMVDAPAPPGAIGPLLQKAGEYVVRYEQQFRNVVAEERYEQRTPSDAGRDEQRGHLRTERASAPRQVRSEVVFAMLPGAVPWLLLRDVLEVDGRRLRSTGRLAPVFEQSPGSAIARTNPISLESERVMLGAMTRTLNVPTAALSYLHPDNRDAFSFKRRKTEQVAGESVVELAFEEVARPTLNQDGAGHDAPIRGRFWIRERDGAVLRCESEIRFASDEAGATTVSGNGLVTTSVKGSMKVRSEFRDDPTLGLAAPVEMREWLEWSTLAGQLAICSGPRCHLGLRPYLTGQVAQSPQVGYGSIESTARYSGFRRLLSPMDALTSFDPSAAERPETSAAGAVLGADRKAVSGSSTPAGRGKP